MGIKDFLSAYGTACALPEIAGDYHGNIVICADGACIWDDLEQFGCRKDVGAGRVEKSGWHFMTVNKMVEVFPGKIEHAYSNSAACLQRFVSARRDEYTSEFGPPSNSHAISKGCDHIWPFGGHGTSGLGACLAAVALGYSRVVLCGMPLDDGPHNGEPHWRRTAFASSEARDDDPHWRRARDLAFEGKVRSMSGRTKEWLGDAMAWA